LDTVKVFPSATVMVAEVAGAVIVTLLIDVAVATPREGVVSDGDVANTRAPDPVSSVTADFRLADDGVARKVATPEASPLIPVATGSPVQFVSVPAEGVPMFGVTRVGLVANTRAPEPVSSEITPASSAEVVAAKAESLLAV